MCNLFMDIGFHFSWIKNLSRFARLWARHMSNFIKTVKHFPKVTVPFYTPCIEFLLLDPCQHLNCQSLFHYNHSGTPVAICLCGFNFISLVIMMLRTFSGNY